LKSEAAETIKFWRPRVEIDVDMAHCLQ